MTCFARLLLFWSGWALFGVLLLVCRLGVVCVGVICVCKNVAGDVCVSDCVCVGMGGVAACECVL